MTTGNERPWLKSYDPHVPPSLEYPRVSLFYLLQEAAEKWPERVALIYFGRQFTYRELMGGIDSMAGSLARMQLAKGSRVALLLPNCPQYVMAYYAALKLGCTVVPVNPLSTEREIAHIIRDAEIDFLLALDLLGEKLANVIREVSGEGDLLSTVVYTSLAEFFPFPLKLVYPLRKGMSTAAKEAVRQGLCLKNFLRQTGTASSEGVAREKTETGAETAVLIYTSGTTGTPKGVMLSDYAMVVNAYHAISWGKISRRDRMLAVLPLFHGFGMSVCMNAMLISGGSVILLPRYDPGELLKIVARQKPTLFAGVPTMYIGILNQPDFQRQDLSSLRGCYVGAASLPREIKIRFEELTGSRLMEGYGLTEAVTAKCANPYQGTNKTGSIGIPFPDTIMKIVDAESGEKELPPGETGEIVISSPDIMLGYYKRPDETASVIRKGWLYTGDLGWMDDDGYFYIVERKKDLIITGGFNVYPREVEDVLYSHPAVKEACVIGVPDEYRGEAVKAFVVVQNQREADPEEIREFCRRHLIPYKVPRSVEIRSDLPKSAIGKVLRKELR